MRRLLFILFLCVHWTAWAQTGYGYRYWFDNDDSLAQTGTSATAAWDFDVDVSGLSESLHILHFQAFEAQTGWSSPKSRPFIKLPVDGEVSVMYWYDNDSTTVNSLKTTGSVDIDVSALSDGVHYLHLMVGREGSTYTTIPRTAIFWKSSVESAFDVTYWFDNETTVRQLGNVQGLVEFDVSKLSDGIHFLHLQARNREDGELSVVKTLLFNKNTALSSYKYKVWLDNDESNAQEFAYTGRAFDLDVSSLTEGFHFLHTQAIGSSVSSAPKTAMFVKVPTFKATDSLECVIYIDEKLHTREKLLYSNGIINTTLDVSSLPQGLHWAQAVVMMPSGIVTAAKTTFFYRTMTTEEEDGMKLYYSIDGGDLMLASTKIENGTYQLDIDVDNMVRGMHTVTCMLIGEDGRQSNQVTGTFFFGYYDLMYVVDNVVVDSAFVEQGTAIEPKAEPVKDGYVFSGWSEVPEIMPAHDVTVTGSFPCRIGDVNIDSIVNVTDLVVTGNHILLRNPENFYFKAGDVNRDAKITMSDIVLISDLVLAEDITVETAGAATRSYSMDVSLSDAVKTDGIVSLPVNVANNIPYSAMQMDVTVPEGMSLSAAELTSRASRHTITWRQMENGKVRIVVYSPNNAEFDGNSGTLLTLSIAENGVSSADIDVAMENVLFVTADGEERLMGGTTSVVNVLNDGGLKIYVSDGKLIIESNRHTEMPLYTVQGYPVRMLQVKAGRNVYDGLSAGIYIINNKKMIIEK